MGKRTRSTEDTRTHLIMPDSHAQPNIDNDRFEWLGNYLVENQPDVFVDIGDSADMPSLCSYDVGKLSAEGRRYVDDIEAYKDAQRKLFAPMIKYNNTHSRWKKKKYSPELVKTRGNHENRINRAAQENPAMYGFIRMEDLEEESFGWKCYDFLQTVVIDNIAYRHYFSSGVLGKPIGGVNHARSLVVKGYMSCVCGHSHMRDFYEDTDAAGRKLFGIVVGCFFGHDEGYTTENDRFWRGIVSIKGVPNKTWSPTFIDYDVLRKDYS